VFGVARSMKRDGRTLGHEALEEMRKLAVQRMNEGERPAAVAASFGMHRSWAYAGNLLELQRIARRDKLRLEMVPLCGDGELDLEWMAARMDDSVRLLSVVHVPSACGTVLPIERIGSLVAAANPSCVYVVDACQSIGQLEVDVHRIGCDVLTAAGRKFLRGPRGTGFAYVAPRFRAQVGEHQIDVHAATATSLIAHDRHDETARRFELSEANPAALIGLAQAVAEAQTQDPAPARALYETLCKRLATCNAFRVLRPGSHHAGILSFVCRERSVEDLMNGLRARGMTAWAITGAHTPLYMSAAGVNRAVRLSIHHHNTPAELDALMAALGDLSENSLPC
jgi:selenocysteine lyase/cysteine desulfurase